MDYPEAVLEKAKRLAQLLHQVPNRNCDRYNEKPGIHPRENHTQNDRQSLCMIGVR